jgi:hypothetical protein
MNAIPSAPVPSLPVAPNAAAAAATVARFTLAHGDTLRTWAAEASRLTAALLPLYGPWHTSVGCVDGTAPYVSVWSGDEDAPDAFHVVPSADGGAWKLVDGGGWGRTVGTFKSLDAALQAIVRTTGATA